MQKRPFFLQHQLGYRRNPFGALTDDEWAAVAILPDAMMKLFATHSTHFQLLGSMGCGKTTSLLKLTEYFSQIQQRVVYEYLAQGEKALKTDTTAFNLFLIDEAQRLSRRARRRLLTFVQNSNGGLRLILSSHQNLAPYFARYGLPLITINLEETRTLAHYEQMLARRLAYFALADADGVTLTPDAIQFLYTTFYPNFRTAEYFLYEIWQRETAVRQITAADLRQQLPFFR